MECGRSTRGRRRPRTETSSMSRTPTARRVLTVAAGALATLLTGQVGTVAAAAAAADVCTNHSPQTLSTSCGGLCADAAPCLAFNASSGTCTAASCVTDSAQSCAFECLYPADGSDSNSDSESADEDEDASLFAFLVEFGSFQSAQEVAERKRDSSAFEAAVAVLGDDTARFPAASNDQVSVIGELDLGDAVTHFTLAGGTSVSDSVKYKVARVAFGSDVISSRTNVTAVALRNLALTDADSADDAPAPLEQLPQVLPATLTDLTLANALLSSFPSLVANFSALQALNLDMNDISAVAGTEAILGLRSLSIQDNALQVFRPVYPNLEMLHLERNNLSDIPSAVFLYGSLRALFLKGNPLSSPAFTDEEADFLAALDVLDLDNDDFSAMTPLSCCVKTQRTVHNLTVCITDAASYDDSDNSTDSAGGAASESHVSNMTAVIVGSVGGAVLLVILVIAGAWLYLALSRYHYRRDPRRNRGENEDEDLEMDRRRSKWMMRESLFGGGVSPPLGHPSSLARSSPRTSSKPYDKLDDDYDERDGDYSDRVSTRSTRSNNSSGVYSVWSDPDLLSLQVRFEDIEDIGTIGSGAYGVVYLVRYRNTQLLASKRLRADQVTKQRTQNFVEEIKMVSALDHPNIVKFAGAAWTIESNLQALFEYMENGDLRDYLLSPASPRHWSQEMLQLAIDVIEALVYVHSFTPPLLHRDLKSRNMLLDASMRAKLTDFGSARYKSINDTMTASVGTGRWLAPEMIQGQNDYDQSADIFSFGVVLSEMDSHAIPYDHVRNANGHKLADIAILQMVATDQLRPTFTAACPAELRLLALRCMAQEPKDRPPAHVVAYELRTLQRSLFTEL